MPKPIEVPNDYKTDFDKQLESSGLIVDNRDNLLPGAGSSELGNQFSDIDIEQYKGTVPNVSLPFKTDGENKAYLDKTYREIKANQQSTMGQIFNATVGGAAAGILGGLENIALIPQSFSDDFEKNPVAQVFADMKQFVNESTPIYTHSDVKGLSDIDEAADIWQGLKSVVDSAVSFGVPGGAIVKGTSYLSKLGRMLRPTSLGKALSARNISNPIYTKANAFLSKAQNSPAFQQMAQAGFTGVISNQLEGTVMAIELYDTVVKDLTAQGIEEGRARQIAQNRANEMEEMNRSMLLTNVFQMYGLNKAIAGTRNIMTAPGMMNNIKASFSLKTPSNNIFLQNLVEAGEEMYQSSIQQSLETLAKKDAKLIETNKNKYELIGNYLFSDQALYEGALGFFGGALQRSFAGITDAVFSDKSETQRRYDDQQVSMQEASSLMSSNVKDFAKAEMIRQKAVQDGDTDFEKLLGDAQFLNLATTSFEMGTTGHLEGILDDMANSEVAEEAESAKVLKDKLLNWESQYVSTPNREQFMRTVANDIYHEQLSGLETKKQDVLTKYKENSLNLAKAKKVVVNQFGVIKEDSLDKHISIDESGKINFSEFIKVENATSIKGMDEFVKAQSSLGLDLDKTLDEISMINETIELNTEALEYSKSPERQEEVTKAKETTEMVNKAKDEVNSSNVRQIEDQLIEDLGDTDVNPDEMVSVMDLFDENKKERKDILDTEVDKYAVESNKVEVDETTTMEEMSDGTRVVESNGEAKVEKVVQPRETISDEVYDEFVDTGKVDPNVIRSLADKVKRGTSLSDRELAILQGNIESVERILQGQATIPAIKIIEAARTNLTKEQMQQPTQSELQSFTKDYNVEADIVDIGDNKIAYLASEFETRIAKGKLTREDILIDGKITLNPEYVYTLHPDNLLPGSELTLKPVSNPDEVMVYDGGERITYKEWKNSNPDLDPSLKLPIEILSNNQVVGYVHDTSWINGDNVQGRTMSIEDQVSRLSNLRKVVLDKGQLITKVSDKSYGKLLTTKLDSIANNTPNSTVALYVDDAFTNSSDKTPINDIEIVGDQIFDTGVTYNLLRVQDNKYIASPVRHSKMSDTLATTVTQAITAYATNEETEATKAIAKESGYDILTASGLSNYIRLFFPVKNTRGYKMNVDNIVQDTYQFLNNSDFNTSITGRPFILVEEGNVIFGREGARADSFSYITKGSDPALLGDFNTVLTNGFINLSVEGFGKSPVLIDQEGKPSKPYETYEQYAKENINTNIYSIDIGGVDIYTTQPIVRFEETKEEVKEEKVTEGITQESQDILDELDDFEFDNEELFDLSPRELTESEGESLKDRIDNLDKTFEGITYLQAGQVISGMINHVSSKALDKAVNLEETLSEYGQILATNLEKYKRIPLDKISERKAKIVGVLIGNYEATLANFEELAQIAVADLQNDDKYKLSLEEVTDEKGDVYDIALYEIDPKSGITSTMKRILGGFTKPKKNFLAMEEYVPFDEAFNTVTAILADTQHNMDSVVKHLSDNLEARPWLKQAIARIKDLEPQLQNQFLSRMIMSKLSMKYVSLKQEGNKIRLDVVNTNRNDIGTAIQDSWRQNIKQSSLFEPIGGSYRPVGSVENLEPTIDNFDTIMRQFGINLSRRTLESIEKYGLNGKPLAKVFTERDGLIKILSREVNSMIKDGLTLADTNPINQGIISKLAYTESRFNKESHLTPNTFRSEEKQLYGYTQHTMTSDRVKGLLDGTKIKELKESAFTKHSYYLSLLDPNNKSKQADQFRDRFAVFDSDLKAFETNLVGNSQKAGNFTTLAEAEHELARIAYFHNSGSKVSNGMRTSRFVFPTMSDKSRVLVMEGLSEDLTGKNAGEVVYDRVILPEVERILSHVDKDIKGYNLGAKLINFMPELNSVQLTEQGITFSEFVNEYKNKAQTREGKALIKEKLLPVVNEYINSEIELKNSKWKELELEKFIPRRKDFTKEFVVNNMINTAEVYQLFIGDPAMFYKSKVLKDIAKYDMLDKKSQVKIATDTFTNVNKRLAMLIAPGIKTADNEKNSYYQIMMADRESASVAYDYLKAFMGEENAREYSEGQIEGADAQEFTTWQEHLYVMEKLGEIQPFTDLQGEEITQEQIDQAKKIFEKNTKLEDLNESQVDLINNLMQVMKPVYSGQVHRDGVQQVVYVKSSAFPLIPQLTQGLEIDRLRQAMEEMQEGTMNTQNGLNGTVRASFGTANKVGSITNTIDIWNEDGSIKDITGEDLKASSMKLTRDNFRIQMAVPFKSGKKSKQDQVNIGTQERKLLFANLMDLKGFNFKGREYTATELYKEYNNLYDNLFKLNLNNLYSELNIDPTSSTPIANQVDIQALADMLQKEATERNYPLGDIRGLELKDGKFDIPLWLHQSSDRYESLLNSIVANRVIGLKMPGYNYVLGTEEGFKDKKITEFDKLDDTFKSKIVFTDSWEGELKPARYVLKSTGETIDKSIDSYKKSDIEFRGSQVIAPMKFRDSKGKLLDLMSKDKSGNYKFIKDTPRGFRLDMSKFDKETLKLFGFRIPTSGLMSMASIEIVGFTPLTQGDVFIASRDFTKQMGSDFDVDKITGYMSNTTMENGKIIIDNSTEEKQLQNDIIALHHSVISHQSDYVQTQIHRPLSFDFASDVAEIIDNKRQGESTIKFTPLSTEYQKGLMMSGVSGKSGCLGLGTKVLMYDGSFKQVEDIIVGDQLMGIDSKPRNVLQLCRGTEQMYWIRQNRGIDYRINASHILSLKKKYPARYSRFTKNGKRYADYTKLIKDKREETVNIKLTDYLNSQKSFKSTTRGYKSLGIEFTRKIINLDPYYVGLWLGDGSKRECDILHNLDEEVVDYLDSTFGIRYTYGLNDLSKVLINTNITPGFKIDFNTTRKGVDKKFIPDNYLYTDKETRLKVLAGLIDSDGSYSKIGKRYSITTNCIDLANQIIFLTRSLGFYSYFSTIKGSTKIYPNGKEYTCTDYYTISFVPECDIPVLIERKKQVPKSKFKNRLHTGLKVEKDIIDDYYGFTLDGDHLFMLEDLTVTHNTGVYSLDVVFHANAQALKAQGTPIELIDSVGNPYNLIVAGVRGHRELGNDETIKPSGVDIARNFLLAKENLTNQETRLVDLLSQSNPENAVTLFEELHPGVIDKELSEFRYISDVLSEAQNYSVDNAKEAIMGRINDNSVTFNARKVFNELGIDKTHDKINTDSGQVRSSVPNLFMTQTILMDQFVPRVLAKQSSLAKYDPNVIGTVKTDLDKLLQEAGSNYKSENKNDIISNITSQEMFDMIGLPFEEMSDLQLTQQSAILDKFIELDMIGSQINSIQTSINTDSKKLGKSLFDNIATIEKVMKLDSKIVAIDEEKYVFNNAEKLIGDYSSEPKEGYRKITKGLYIKPETVNGFATIHGLVTALDLYKDVFPYTDKTFNNVAQELGQVLGKEETTTRLRQDLLKTLKSFVYSQSSIQNLSKSTNETRAELFIDTDTNMSLARYLESSITTNPKLRKYAIINSVNLRVESNGQPSVILWNNSAQNEFEDQFYMSFLGMLQDESSLPDYNGQAMTVQSLAQNMITYAYLEGGIQQATQFIRHIPVEYLDAFGISENLREIDINKPSTYGINTAKMKEADYVPDIIRQYVQHNPRKAEQVEGTGDFLELGVSELGSKFVSTFDKDLVTKGVRNSGIQLYELMTGSQGKGYYKIPVLGVSNFNEYNLDARGIVQESLVHKKVAVEKAVKSTKGNIPVETKAEVKKSYQINTNESKNILKQINNPLAKVYENVDKQFKVRTIKGYKFEGAYKDGVIYLSEGFIKEVAEGKKTKEYFERVFLEEYTHAVTRDALINPTKEQTKIVDQITRYYGRARKAITDKFGEERLLELEERFKDPRSPKGLTKEERAYIYGGINIVEFVGHLMTNSEFQEMLNDVTFQRSGRPESFWNKIKQLMTKLISNIVNLPNLKENSLTTLAVADILDLIGQGKIDVVSNAKPKVQNELVEPKVLTPIDKSERQYKLPDGRVITFNMQQWEGLQKMEKFLKSGDESFVLSGYAGTGKTTIVKKILDSYRGEVKVSAPTHKAKKVISATTGKKAYTLQALLGLRPNVDMDNFNPNNPQFKALGEKKIQYTDLLVIDEASMINKDLYKLLIKEAKDAGTKIIFMGDPAQIPPVGETKSLVFDNISHQLTQVERTTSGNPLLPIFDSIRANISSKNDNFAHTTNLNKQGEGVEFESSIKVVKDKVFNWFKSPKFKENINYAKVITYTNDSVQTWNKLIRRELTDSTDIVTEGDVLMAYDTVQLNKFENLIENSQDYKVKKVVRNENAFILGKPAKGYRVTLDTNNSVFIIDHNDPETVKVFLETYYDLLQKGIKYKSWGNYYDFKKSYLNMKAFKYKGKSFQKTLDYGYAVTAHKSQGSTYNKVAIIEDDIDDNRKTQERNQIKYVAFSRAKENVVSLTNKAGQDIQRETIEDEFIVDDNVVEDINMEEFISIKDLFEENPKMNIKFKGKMTYNYGNNKREDVTSLSTLEAIKKGERTATTRYENQGNISYWKRAKIGDLIEFTGVNGSVIVEVTKPLHKLSNSGKTPEIWSKLEGWSIGYFNSKVRSKLNQAWQMEYKVYQGLDLSPTDQFNVSDFRQSLTDEDRKLFNRLKRQGVIKTKCK